MWKWDARRGRASQGVADVAAAVPPRVGLSKEQQAAAVRQRMKHCLRPKQLRTLAEARHYDQSWNQARFTPQYHEVP